ncbi:30S ribosomal protein S16 [Patescibacteria group bacterium]
MLVVRLSRVGAKNDKKFRVLVQEHTWSPNGRFVEILGNYNPQTNPLTFEINRERYDYWVSKGAQPSDSVASLVKMDPQNPPKKKKPKKKKKERIAEKEAAEAAAENAGKAEVAAPADDKKEDEAPADDKPKAEAKEVKPAEKKEETKAEEKPADDKKEESKSDDKKE